MKNLRKFEDIKVPINVGDTVLGGRFKNKKTIVKKIGKNKKGDITINDKPLLKYRILKESIEDDIKMDLAYLIDDGFIVDISKEENSYFVRVWFPIDKSDNEYSYKNSMDFNWSDIEGEIARTISYISESYEVDYFYTIASREQDGLGYKRTEWMIDSLVKNGTFGTTNPGRIKSVLFRVIC